MGNFKPWVKFVLACILCLGAAWGIAWLVQKLWP